ncbi:MAG: rod shape-determining protein MreC [Saprospiraceae bacterium]|nr:rod shape-determining protein MreC [Saprospiraceae bacterium]
MWKFARVIVQHGSLVLFVLLQALCLIWVVKYNQPQQKIYLYSYQLMASSLQSKVQRSLDYISLREKNDSLAEENARLLEKIMNGMERENINEDSLHLPVLPGPYKVLSARVINNALDRRNNMITLDRGGQDGIAPGMGVITASGIVGIVTDTSQRYSLVMSLLHSNTAISARLSRSGFFGPLVWEGHDPAILRLKAIQKYADVRMGDTVVTSGYSVVFPKNLTIGTVSMHRVSPGSFTYDIDVRLSQPMTKLDQVYVIINEQKEEKLELESKFSRYE